MIMTISLAVCCKLPNARKREDVEHKRRAKAGAGLHPSLILTLSIIGQRVPVERSVEQNTCNKYGVASAL